MKLLILIATAFLVHSANAAKPESVLLYLDIQKQLSSDSMKDVQKNATKIAKLETGSKTAVSAQKFSQSKDIEEARNNFKALSEDVISTTPKKDFKGAQIAFCPMANARWLQKEKELRNPYYGSSMLQCGRFE